MAYRATDPAIKRAVLSLLARGQITTAEAARFADVSRPLIHYWMRDANIDYHKVRRAYLARLWQKALNGA